MKPNFPQIPEKVLQEALVINFRQRDFEVIEQCVDDPTLVDDITKCATHEVFGIDVVAQKGRELWIMEVKGQPKGGVSSCSTIMMAGIGQILTRITKVSKDIHYALAIPNTHCFALSVRKFIDSPVMPLLNLSLVLIQEDGRIELIR